MKQTINTQNPSLINEYYTNNQKFDTATYWEFRYANNGNSGAGSYGKLADFKAKVINGFIHENELNTILEFGCGDGNQLSLAKYNSYIGVDLSETAISYCQDKFKSDTTKEFYTLDNFKNITKPHKSDLVLSLDVIYHIVEENCFEDYMTNLFKHGNKYIIIYANDVNIKVADHIKCRNFSKWVNDNVASEWQLEKVINNDFPYKGNNPFQTSMSDFYIYKRKDL